MNGVVDEATVGWVVLNSDGDVSFRDGAAVQRVEFQ
jgi:hypothetical protein